VNRSSPNAPKQITSFERAEKAWPAWSESSAALFYARLPALGPELIQVDHLDGKPNVRRVFSADRTKLISGVSNDGTAVLVEILGPDSSSLERWSIVSDRRERIANIPARFAREFFRNGKSGEEVILYSQQQEGNGLFVWERGQSRKIYPSLVHRSTFTYRDGHAYLASGQPQLGIYKVNIETGSAKLLVPLDKNPGWGMDISPDGKELLIALYDFEDTNIVGVDLP
jgi:hypothetical protein